MRQLIGNTKASQVPFSPETPKIYFSVSSEGLGHASRTMALANLFPHSEILYGTYGYALERSQKAGLPSIEVPQEYKLIGDSGRFDVGKTIIENPSSLLNLTQMVADEREIMIENQVTLVIADGRIAPVIAASGLGIPSLVLTNQSNFYSFFQTQDSPLVKLFGKSFEWWMGQCLSLADEIIIPDFFPPDCVCLYNLSNNPHIKKTTRFLGPLVSWKAKDIIPYQRPEHYSAYVVVSLGGHAYRRPLLDMVLKTAPQFPHIQFDILSSLDFEPSAPNVVPRGQVPDSSPYFKAADCVITQAGHSTAMELLMLGTPAIVIPDEDQSEQENNAFQLEIIGSCRRLTYDLLSKRSESLAQALDSVLKDDRYKRAAMRMSEIGAAVQDQQIAKSLLSERAHRLVIY